MNRGQDESYKSGQRMMWPDTLPANRPERCRCSATLCGRRKQGHPEDDSLEDEIEAVSFVWFGLVLWRVWMRQRSSSCVADED